VEVARLPRKIDAVLTVATEAERLKICEQTPFFYWAKHNQLEFKGRRDALTETGYHTIDGRKHFLLSEQKISPFALAVTIICASKPRTVLTYAEKLERPFVPVTDGYYKREGHPPVYLIVVNELPLLPKNYPLLVFAASERKFREFLQQIIQERSSIYIRYAYEVRPKVTKAVLTMAGISATLSRKDLEFMAEDIGSELMAFMEPEDVVKGMDAEKQRRLVELLDPQPLLDKLSVEELLQGISPEKQKTLFEMLSKMQETGTRSHQEKNGVRTPDEP
jgi:hypothetical protein